MVSTMTDATYLTKEEEAAMCEKLEGIEIVSLDKTRSPPSFVVKTHVASGEPWIVWRTFNDFEVSISS